MWASVVVGVLALASCTKDFTDMNTNPAGVTDDQANADYALITSFMAQAQRNVIPEDVGRYQLGNNLCSDAFGGYFAVQAPFVGNANNLTYSIVPSWLGALWSDRYIYGMNPVYRVENFTRDNDILQDVFAFAKIIKVAVNHRTADKVGPIIYSRYNQPNEQGQLEFDDQEEVYGQFFVDLDTATNILQGLQGSTPSAAMVSSDLAYDSQHHERWLKVANTLRLRLAMRISYVSPELAKAEGEKAMNPANGGLLEDVSDNCFIDLSGDHPLNIITTAWSDTRMAAPIESILGGYEDPRLPKYFRPAVDAAVSGQYKGIRAGINIDAKSRYDEYSRLTPRDQKMQFAVAAESWFLKAEAALRGWQYAGEAKVNYETGIQKSFEMHGLQGEAASYLSNSTARPKPYVDPKSVTPGQNDVLEGSPYLSTARIAWDDAASNNVKLEQIITQKWIAIFPDGDEAWAEYRRTGYPVLFPVVVNYSGNAIPTVPGIRRMPYPEREYNSNTEALSEAIQMLGGTDNGSVRLWWDVENKAF